MPLITQHLRTILVEQGVEIPMVPQAYSIAFFATSLLNDIELLVS